MASIVSMIMLPILFLLALVVIAIIPVIWSCSPQTSIAALIGSVADAEHTHTSIPLLSSAAISSLMLSDT